MLYLPSEIGFEEDKLGWLAPDGTFYGCAYYDHNETARDLIKSLYHEEVIYCPDDYLTQRGWVQISMLTLGNVEFTVYLKHNITEAQKSFLKNWRQERIDEDDFPLSETTRMLFSKYVDEEGEGSYGDLLLQ